MQRIFLDSSKNTRDLAQYPTMNNKKIKKNLLFRGNLIKNLSNESMNELKKLNLRTIIDLRNDQEVKENKSIFMNDNYFKFYHIKANGDGLLPKSSEVVINSYIEILEGKEEIKKIFDILIKSEYSVLFHCHSGKDRTGVLSAIILLTLGVSNDDIAKDYCLSGEYIKEEIEEYAKGNEEIKKICTPIKETIFKLIEYINNTYGNIEGYLLKCGLSQEDIQSFKLKYLE